MEEDPKEPKPFLELEEEMEEEMEEAPASSESKGTFRIKKGHERVTGEG